MKEKTRGYYILDREILETLGTECACLYAVLEDFEAYTEKNGQKTRDNFFYLTSDTGKTRTTLSKHKQTRAIKKLEEHGYIRTRVAGIPKKRYFQLASNFDNNSKKIELTEVKNFNVQKSKNLTIEVKNFNERKSKNLTNVSQKIEHNKELITNNKNKELITNKTEVCTIWQNYAGMINLQTHQDIEDAVTLYGEEWCKQAIALTKEKNVKNWKYPIAILRDWASKFPASAKPWEGVKGGRNKNTDRQNLGNATSEQWKQEPDKLIL